MAYHSKPIRMAKTPKQVKTIAAENWKQQNVSFMAGGMQVVGPQPLQKTVWQSYKPRHNLIR